MPDPTDLTLRAYEAHAARYLAASATLVNPEVASLLDLLVARLPERARVLEVGSAGGVDAAYLEARGLVVDRTDAAETFVELLRAQGHQARRLDVRDGDLGGPYEAVLANAVLLHLDRGALRAALAACRDAVLPGGLLALTMKEGDGDGWSEAKLGAPRWFTYWRAAALEEQLNSAGWSVITCDRVPGRDEPWLHVLCTGSQHSSRPQADRR